MSMAYDKKVTDDTKQVLESAGNTVSSLSAGGINTGDLLPAINQAKNACSVEIPAVKTPDSGGPAGPEWRSNAASNSHAPSLFKNTR